MLATSTCPSRWADDAEQLFAAAVDQWSTRWGSPGTPDDAGPASDVFGGALCSAGTTVDAGPMPSAVTHSSRRGADLDETTGTGRLRLVDDLDAVAALTQREQ
jgi:hypothetical protein